MYKKIESHKDLIVWQKSLELVERIYQLTKEFPKDELYGLTSQMRRAAITIPTNITEGYQRNYIKEYIQFLYISKSSASELETQFIIAKRLGLVDGKKIQETENLLSEILKMLTVMIERLKMKHFHQNYN